MSCVLDQTDKKILTLLQQDASVSNLELSKAIGLSPSACLTRTKSLKEEGYIKQYTAILDEARKQLKRFWPKFISCRMCSNAILWPAEMITC